MQEDSRVRNLQLCTDQAGRVAFDESGQLNQSAGPIRFQGDYAMTQRKDENDESPIFFVTGPFRNARSLMHAQFDRFFDSRPDRYGQSVFKFLQIFLRLDSLAV